MLANGCMDDTAVEEDLGSICNRIERRQGLLELLIVVMGQCLNPGLYFLPHVRLEQRSSVGAAHLLERHGAAPKRVGIELLEVQCRFRQSKQDDVRLQGQEDLSTREASRDGG